MYLWIDSYCYKDSKSWNEDALKLHVFHSVYLCGKCNALKYLKVNNVFLLFAIFSLYVLGGAQQSETNLSLLYIQWFEIYIFK